MRLNVQERLSYAVAVVAVLRLLRETNETIRYHALGQAIGFIPESEPWHVRYRDPITEVLCLAAAAARQGGAAEVDALEWHRIVDQDGSHFQETLKKSRIVSLD